MIAAAERSVIITLKLAADEQNKATAGLVASQAESVALAGKEGYDKLLKIAAETDNRINQVHAAQGKLRVDLDRQEVGERLRIVEDAVVVFAESEKKKTEAAENEDEIREKKRLADQKKQEKEDKKKLKKAKEFAQKLQKAEETRVASNQKANESAVIAVQGMADMVEGAAKLGMISEENFEKFAQNFHMIQDGIRVFKGFTDVIWKTREGLVALSAASKAQAVANEMISASNLKATASTTVTGGTQVVGRTAAGVGSKVAGGAAMGVGGTTVAAGGSVVGGALIFAKIAAVMAGLAAAGLAVHDLFKGFLSLFIDFGEDAGTASLAVKDLWEAQEQEAKSTEKLTKAEEARQRILDARARFEDQEAKKADLERDLRGAQYDVRESRSIAGGETVSETDRARLTALEDVRAAENAILDDRKKQEDRIAYGHWESLNNRERVMKDLEAAQGRLLEAEKNRLKVIVDQKKQIGEQLKAEKEKLKVAEDATKSEKQRLLERYGRLNKLEKSRVDAIGLKQAQGGQLNKREIKVLEDAGLAGNIASDYYAAQGAVAGGSQTINNLGLMKQKEEEAAKIRAKKQDKEQELLRKKAEEDQAHAAVVSAAEQRQRIVNSRVAINANQLRVDPTEIAGYRSDQDQFVKELQKAASDARDASDNVTQRSIEVAQAMDHALGAMNDGLFELKRTIEKDRNLQKAYGKD